MNDSAKRNFHARGMRGKTSRKDYTPEESDYVKFMGQKIKKRRRQLGLTQSNVGKMIFTTFLTTETILREQKQHSFVFIQNTQ